MKIRELSMKNCLSFGDKGLNQNNSIQLADFNLFIGSNNAGKSNVLKLMGLLKNILSSVRAQGNPSLRDIPVSFEGQPIDWVFTQDSNKKMVFSFSLEIENTDLTIPPYTLEDKDPVSLMMLRLKKDWPKVLKVTGVIEYKGGHPYATLTKVEIPNDHQAYREAILFDRTARKILALRHEPPLNREVWKIIEYPKVDEAQWKSDFEAQWTSDFTVVGSALHKFLVQLYDKVFEELLVNIRAIRKITPVGDEIVESLSSLRDGVPHDRKLEKSVINYIKTLIFADESQEISFVYPGETGRHQIKIQIGELQLPLSHYGSGVEQMLALAAEIVRHGSNKVILIEEPEAHFHPELQRKFMKFLSENQQTFAHQYLMATHSSIFINEFINVGGDIFYVYLHEVEGIQQKYSQVEALNPENLKELFKDLGVKPQDLLLANGILVVEGRTDRDVYTDWARKIGKPFERIALEVIDVDGAGNISKYLGSEVIQRTCFTNYGLCDKNAETGIREKLRGIVPDRNIIALEKGDLEDYYPRELVVEFATEWGRRKGKKEEEIPKEIKEGETVKTLVRLLGRDWWKTQLAEKVIKDMKPTQMDEKPRDEVRDKLIQIYKSIY